MSPSLTNTARIWIAVIIAVISVTFLVPQLRFLGTAFTVGIVVIVLDFAFRYVQTRFQADERADYCRAFSHAEIDAQRRRIYEANLEGIAAQRVFEDRFPLPEKGGRQIPEGEWDEFKRFNRRCLSARAQAEVEEKILDRMIRANGLVASGADLRIEALRRVRKEADDLRAAEIFESNKRTQNNE